MSQESVTGRVKWKFIHFSNLSSDEEIERNIDERITKDVLAATWHRVGNELVAKGVFVRESAIGRRATMLSKSELVDVMKDLKIGMPR